MSNVKLSKNDFTVVEGVITGRDGLYQEKLAECTELTMDHVKEYENFNRDFVAETVAASGELAQQTLEDDKELSDIDTIVKLYGRSEVTVKHMRTSSGRNPKTGETTTSYGSTRVNVKSSYGLSSGPVGSARKNLREMAEKRWG